MYQKVDCAEIEHRTDQERLLVRCHNYTPSKGRDMSVHHAMDILIL
jgi:hypothetical protein